MKWTILFLLLLAGCAPERMTEAELVAYIKDVDNGLIKTKEMGPIKIETIFRPVDFMISRNYREEISENPEVVDSLRNALSEQVFFMMKLSWNGKEVVHKFLNDAATYQKASTYLSEFMASDISLSAGDTANYPVSAYYYTPMFGMVDHSAVLFAFPREAVENNRSVRITLRDQMFGIGIATFDFRRKDILSAPGLKL